MYSKLKVHAPVEHSPSLLLELAGVEEVGSEEVDWDAAVVNSKG